MQWAIFIENLP